MMRKPLCRIAVVLCVLTVLSGCDAIKRSASALSVTESARVEYVQPLTVRRLPFPYGQISVRIDGGAPGRMMLAQEEGDTQQWLAADGKAIWIQGDWRIVATRGFTDDLVAYQRLTPLPNLEELAQGRVLGSDYSAYARGDDHAIGRILVSRFVAVGSPVSIEKGGSVRSLQRMEERVYHTPTQTQYTNVLWLDRATNQVARLEQRLPGTPHRIDIVWLYASDTSKTSPSNEEPSE